jgi:hypothetical protein
VRFFSDTQSGKQPADPVDLIIVMPAACKKAGGISLLS